MTGVAGLVFLAPPRLVAEFLASGALLSKDTNESNKSHCPNFFAMLRAVVIGALVCIALANVLPVNKPLQGLSVSFSKSLKNDAICKTCVEEAVVMYDV
jgi:hypothetical protein